MKRTFVFFINTLLLLCLISVKGQGQDTISFPFKIRIGVDVYGPGYYFTDRNTFNIEGFISADRDTIKAYSVDAGYTRFNYEQYNYNYKCNGFFIRAGMDFNIISPGESKGKYFAGGGLRYGLSLYTQKVPYLESENYWGKVSYSTGESNHLAHFIEASPGIRTELFRNFSIGWTIRLRILIYSGTNKDMKPIYIPGYGNGTKSFSPGINYYLAWSIPYKKISIIKKGT
ncbi:MAG: DUF6048 family protein [Bacteroidales bacterium]